MWRLMAASGILQQKCPYNSYSWWEQSIQMSYAAAYSEQGGPQAWKWEEENWEKIFYILI